MGFKDYLRAASEQAKAAATALADNDSDAGRKVAQLLATGNELKDDAAAKTFLPFP